MGKEKQFIFCVTALEGSVLEKCFKPLCFNLPPIYVVDRFNLHS